MNANKLKQTHMRTLISAQVEELIRVLDDMIAVANDSGRNNIIYHLPTNLIFDGISPAEARLIVYSELIKKYKTAITAGGKGFPETYFAEDPPRICVCWKIGLSQDEKTDRSAILASAKPPANIRF